MTAVAVIGAAGRMGRTTCEAVEAAADLTLSARIGSGDDLLAGLKGAQVAVVMTGPEGVDDIVATCVEQGVHAVVGTTGWTEAGLAKVRAALAEAPEVGVLLAPNFALGAVLLMRFAAEAAKHFESVEVVELHHPNKADAPSGTARHTAQQIAAARREAGVAPSPDATTSALDGARGADVEGVRVHSVRLRGLVAHEEVLLGGPGEQLTIRHDSFDRISFMPGVLLAVRQVAGRPGLVQGLEHYL
ncbi:4-hydroxy-tetrahydrodipicolinate reductase [Kineosporia rhizophila]|uniref:4-hydroxy-tetrahydrodipicolinate reductase n=1 Tax=Kineosporia TaxID=49184 RepID=UPI001E2BD474|nr:4-hydroxy-tetrahydrodipicolinate reductase [Kineosporia sp. NBRC 101677]MCE0540280.1 4-hydroxy-tetrahydrodipicolinate reductase [Kineosporia rhizophila]